MLKSMSIPVAILVFTLFALCFRLYEETQDALELADSWHRQDIVDVARWRDAQADLWKAESELERANEVLAELFDMPDGFELDIVIRYPVKITAYSLSVDECDEDPLTAAFGPSRIAMIAPSNLLIAMANLQRGDRYAIVSNDGSVRTVGIYWDHMSDRWLDMRLDIVAPHKEVAKWHGVRDGYLVKLVPKEV